jgi:hypothetical protein
MSLRNPEAEMAHTNALRLDLLQGSEGLVTFISIQDPPAPRPRSNAIQRRE